MANWKGCFISEGLKDPTKLNQYQCYKFRITKDNLDLDVKGTKGRWHMFWIEVDQSAFEEFKENLKYNWYGHFWNGNDIVAIFEGACFKLKKDDKQTWQEAFTYGKSQGISEAQLDFLTD
jgi:hypothetical protein